MKLVSVIMPYYKKRKYVKSSIYSVLKQTYKYFELIVVYDDPGSQDIIFLKRLAKKDKRIKLIINKKNYGAGISRNIGIKKARGYFIAFIDSDDLWHKSKLIKQVNFMSKLNCLVSHTDYKIVKKNNSIEYRKAENLRYDDIIYSCDIGLSTVMIKKSIINKLILFPNLKTKEDFVFWLKLTKKYKCVFFPLNSCLTKWRQTSGSLSSSFYQKVHDAFKVYNIFCNFNFIKSFLFTIILSFNYLKKSSWK